MADLLEVNRHLLAKYELGLRSLPTLAAFKLSQIELLSHQPKLPDASSSPMHTTANAGTNGNKKMHSFIRECTNKALLLERKLESMEKNSQQNTRLMEIIPLLKPATTAGTIAEARLNLLENKALKTSKENSDEEKAILRARINGLKKQEAEARQWLGEG